MTAKYINHNFELKDQGASNFVESDYFARHRWYYYKEGFSPNLVRTAIESRELTPKHIILDPFNGSGTVTLTAAEHNIPSVGIEVNPFTTFVAKTKTLNTNPKVLSILFEETYENAVLGRRYSHLEKYSTFTELSGKDKWLFNLDILRSFYGGYSYLENNNSNASKMLRLALINSIMDVSNAKKDGKCLRYKSTWKELKFSKNDFLLEFEKHYKKIKEDIEHTTIKRRPKIYNADSRSILKKQDSNFDLIITSPPYLNTFDYTDIYRPELFVGKFISSQEELYKLRLKTVRSHIQAKWKAPKSDYIDSLILKDVCQRLESKKDLLMHSRIPQMVLAYFEDMKNIFYQLAQKANRHAHLWMVVSNSAYANEEIPVDLILADIATRHGWKLKEIGVLREIRKRKTKYSPDVSRLRESAIILEKK